MCGRSGSVSLIVSSADYQIVLVLVVNLHCGVLLRFSS